MMNSTLPMCYIFGAGDFTPCPITLKTNDHVIAADGGYDHLVQLGLRADVVLGDFDSVTSTDVWADDFIEKITYPVKKDDTDMMLAVKLGLSRGYKQFSIYGGLGGRLDHTIGNIQVLSYLAKQGAQGILYHKDQCATVIASGSFILDKSKGGTISVFSLSDECTNVCIKGLEYEVKGLTLTNTFPLGISNEATGKKGIISLNLIDQMV